MKKVVLVVIGMVFLVSCGGGNSGDPAPTPDPTSTDTKVTAGASVSQTESAIAAAIEDIGGGADVVSPLGLKGEIETLSYTYECAGSGSAIVSGVINGDCTTEGATVTCTISSTTVNVDFDTCIVTQTIGGTDYEVTVHSDNSGDTRVTSTVSGTITGTVEGVSSVNLTGDLSGVPTVAWTDGETPVEGTADLDGISWAASGAGPTVTCSGTAAVTVDATEQTCTISTDCSTCEE